MFLGVGVGLPGAAVFHLVTHAFFKGLFLCAGSVIHAMGGEQDMRRMGGARAPHPDHLRHHGRRDARHRRCRRSPRSSQGRDHLGSVRGPQPHPILGVIAYAAAGLTAFYMGRLMCLTFFGACRADITTRRSTCTSRRQP
jgi:NADH-quinone oxidoreductase subunit L